MSDPVPTPLEIAKGDKIVEIEAAYEDTVHTSFQSNALGTVYWYISDLEGHVNLIGAVLANQTVPYRCSTTKGGQLEFRDHTATQINQVFQDGVTIKIGAISNRAIKLADIDAATTVAAVEAITW